MAVSAYPMPAAGGPQYLKLLQLPDEYPSNVFKQMVDGGGTHGADSTSKVLRWELTYDGLTSAQGGTLDTHNSDANHTLLGFSFTDPRTSTTYTDVHYEAYERDHSKTWIQSRRVTLVKRPA